MTEPEIAVVILEHNRARYLEILLAKLAEQDIEVTRFRVIVVDNGSAVPLRPIVDSYSSRLRIEWVRINRPRSIAVAKNMGIDRTTEALVLVLDGDVLPGRDLVRRHLAVLSAPDAAVSIGTRREGRAVDPGAGQPPGTPMVTYGLLQRAAETDVRLPLVEQQIIQDNFDRLGYYFLYGHNFALRREFLIASGGFDETLEGWGLEDVELGFRIRLALPDGYLMKWSPQAAVSHIPHLRRVCDNLHDMELNKQKALETHRSFHWEGRYRVSGLLECSRILLLEKLADHLRDTQSVPVDVSAVKLWLDRGGGSGSSYLISTGRVCGWDPILDRNRSALVTWRDRSESSFSGLQLPVADRSLANLINVDVWRVLPWWHVSEALEEALRVARNVVFVATARHDRTVGELDPSSSVLRAPRFVEEAEWLVTALREFGFVPQVMRTGEVMAVCVGNG
ncbi:MAG TPA: glycosyltransferase [Pseudonocardiaceae bacterium]|jgi:GT2 family glycosyltransferase|nr:glycosyltransferase [Pseudonocardiaceae bacterium]